MYNCYNLNINYENQVVCKKREKKFVQNIKIISFLNFLKATSPKDFGSLEAIFKKVNCMVLSGRI